MSKSKALVASNKNAAKEKEKGKKEVKEFWLEIQKSDVLSAAIFNISREDVLAQVKGSEEDRDLMTVGFESMEQEMGRVDWIVGKLPESSSLSSSSSSSTKPRKEIDAKTLSPEERAHKAQLDSLNKRLDESTRELGLVDPICFLSKLPDGVFISGNTSRALGRHRADFVTFNVSFFFVCVCVVCVHACIVCVCFFWRYSLVCGS